MDTPGIHAEERLAEWKKIVAAGYQAGDEFLFSFDMQPVAGQRRAAGPLVLQGQEPDSYGLSINLVCSERCIGWTTVLNLDERWSKFIDLGSCSSGVVAVFGREMTQLAEIRSRPD